MKLKKAIREALAMYEQDMATVAERRGITLNEAKAAYADFIKTRWVFGGKGNIWRMFNEPPLPQDFHIRSHFPEVDFVSSAEITAFMLNESEDTVIAGIEDCIRDAYEHRATAEINIFEQFSECPTLNEFGNVFLATIKKELNFNKK